MKTYTDDAMSAAVSEVKNKRLSVREAAKKYSVPKSSLSDRVTGRVSEGSIWGKKPLFSKTDEKEMVDCAIKRAQMGIGFSKTNFWRFAGVAANNRGIKLKGTKPSDMWWRKFKSRHNSFSLRTPEATGTVRHDAMSRNRMASYFSELGKVVLDINFKNRPERIWNMDETGVTLAHRPVKVLAKKGAKAIHGKTSSSRELVTVIACGNAAGSYIPPHFIMPGKTRKKLDGYDTEAVNDENSSIRGANFSVSESGWTKDGIAKLWFSETFIKHIGPARPQLLICDGHGSHNNVEFVELARQNDIVVVELPSHTSNWTQPFDRTVFKSLKSHWNSAIDDFIKSTGVAVGHRQFLKIFNIAWQAAMLPQIIKNGFEATGIYPYNPSAIPDEAFAPNEGLLYSQANQSDNVSTVVDEAGVEFINVKVAPESHCEKSSNVTTVTVSVPLDIEGQFDLPVVLDPFDGLVCDTNITGTNITDSLHLETADKTECSPKQALDVVESTLSTDQMLKFQAALISNSSLKDPLFQTWKFYYQRVNNKENISPEATIVHAFSQAKSPVIPETCASLPNDISTKSVSDGSLFSLLHFTSMSGDSPFAKSAESASSALTPVSSTKASASVTSIASERFPIPSKSNKKKESSFFVITADEIYFQKKQAHEMKMKREALKEQRRIERERKKIEKNLTKVNKSRGRGRKVQISDVLDSL